ncbi:C3G guanyl-nucleotide exchange factor isoform X1 [Megalopta genalis]|uniref:C3G guanyl-nucleotide exchange factor isoform X1 n=2 Tax=Megalopta genalis TaxID=115081 RepID=UPI0014437C0B|nr:guanine nucleotide-releasing factor 2-like isoform X1 [Megalopta genalis]XP_033323197.1 guanine nucleotide-releasing factor 2-like isoform X1 [Megalopta genalis]XP_033323198.1 guanine nucleotide-releasing factor 2-like isoform X1 [Megalopta genalis]XP_033323199.1 guanine nucleotide-releasing factor 2-like isoform X1 [Megalopta genalis]XP_033323200.1 guanine nucleotide-releasing factor 2-like isoform X2 [Megalopta genalis]XP_033323201.1 guanine nucleotide-releasing factor 2-like isoform X3 [
MPQYDESFLDSPIFRRRTRSYAVQKEFVPKSRSFITATPLLLAVTNHARTLSGSISTCSLKEVEERSSGKARGGKLARRARSFKEDFLEKLSQMRSPGSVSGGGGSGAATRAASPSSPRTPRDKNAPACTDTAAATTEKNPIRDLHIHVRQVQLALLHFRDVVWKKKLEMLPGNGTIVLDTITTIQSVLKSYLLYENSSALGSATDLVYQTLAQLLQLCDEVLLQGDQSPALDTEHVTHVIRVVEEAVKNLVALANEKIANRQKPAAVAANNRTSGYGSELTPQRNSLPDIPLTPRERQILEQTAATTSLVRSSHSSESILRDSSPPPKPPLPERTNVCLSEENSSSGTPPPLPPKRKTRAQQLLEESEIRSLLASSLDRVSLRSQSPVDSSSLLSASGGSLDSALNHSRDEDEIRAIMGPNDESLNVSMDSLMATIQGMQVNGTSNCSGWDGSETSITSIMLLGQTPQEMLDAFTGIEGKLERLSTQTQESGVVSMHSQRSSSQSYTTSSITSKRSSQQSSISYNSQTFNSQQQSFSQTKVSSDSNGSIFTQKTMSSSESTISTTNISGNGDPALLEKLVNEIESISVSDTNGVPPALPEKRSKRRKERQPSQYDNVPENEHLSTCSLHTSNGDSPDASKPPPLPLKKRHMFQSVAYSVMAYMEMFGNCSHSNNDFISGLGTRHSVAAYNSMQAEWQKHEMALTTTQSCSFMAHTMTTLHDSSNTSITMTPPVSEVTNNSSLPPALPPKRSRSIKSNATPPPISPKPTVSMQSIHTIDPVVTSTPVKIEESVCTHEKKDITPSTPVKLNNVTLETILPPSRPASNALSTVSVDESTLELRDVDQDVKYSPSILEELDVTKYLVFKKPDEEGPDIRGGHPDALLIHATKANKHDEKESDFLYQEAFLTTYRTFMQPLELIRKLHRRHQLFSCSADVIEQRAAREAFSLLVRVVSDLTISDLDDTLLQTLMEYVLQLVCTGDLTMAKALRVKILEKHQAKQLQSAQPILSSLSVTTKQASLLDFKSEQIAEQMTLLDADLFMKIEIPEVLIWAQEQNEERSPNLTRFTEHFNKMSYWARSRILEHRLENEAKDREKYVVKFIKIMKHLRKINNFNSYLALLSALDSAPIRRLEWQKHITEGLKEYCALIDSSSSFRAYRQALAETQPPCIPYIGLVLQDLTFVHIGNNDLLPDGTINFSKRWQQFNIVENMKRFKKGRYSFKKHERIITFFNNFSDFLCEEAMWQISESIKPRGGKKTQSQN